MPYLAQEPTAAIIAHGTAPTPPVFNPPK